MNPDNDILLFDIQGFSLHDGPGCRTLIFFSGCPLHCFWCANPEGQFNHPRLLFRSSRCQHCFSCLGACPHAAISQPLQATHPQFDRCQCEACELFSCAKVCPSEALTVSGKRMNVAQIMRLLNRDRIYWGDQGGVTIGGGEPFFQPQALLCLLNACRESYIHTAVESCGLAKSSDFQSALPLIDTLFFDIKHMDGPAHQRGTGTGNKQILQNLRFLRQTVWDGTLHVRLTVVPGFNDHRAHLQRLAKFLRDLGIDSIELLALHQLGASKYIQLGLLSPYESPPITDDSPILKAAFVLKEMGLSCVIDDSKYADKITSQAT